MVQSVIDNMEFTPSYENFLDLCLKKDLKFFDKPTLLRYTGCVTCNIIKSENKHFEELWASYSNEGKMDTYKVKLFIRELLIMQSIAE